MQTNRLPAVATNGTGTALARITEAERKEEIENALADLRAIRTFVQAEMRPAIDFGTIPGTGKPALLLPGAQKTALYFRSVPRFKVRRTELGDGHLEVEVRCLLISRSTGRVNSEGFGSCSTMEKKYRVRSAERTCPECGKAAIIKGKEEYGGGWVCFRKKGGCNAKFRDDAPEIVDQAVGERENPDIYDVRNTVLKMGIKRAQVAAALNLGCLAELFTQDLEDTYDLSAAPPVVEVDRGSPAPDREEPEPPPARPAPKPPTIDPRLPSQARPPSQPEKDCPQRPMEPLDPRDEAQADPLDGFLDYAEVELPPKWVASGKPGDWFYRWLKERDGVYPGIHRSLMRAAHNDKLPVNMLGWGADDVLWAYRSVLGWIANRERAKGVTREPLPKLLG